MASQFHNLIILGINEPQNWDVMGFCSWIKEVCIQEEILADLQQLTEMEIKITVTGSKAHGNNMEKREITDFSTMSKSKGNCSRFFPPQDLFKIIGK